jgi:hypothetical protein
MFDEDFNSKTHDSDRDELSMAHGLWELTPTIARTRNV